MGAEVAATASKVGPISLDNFAETLVVKLKLRHGNWAIFGRVLLQNFDGDNQSVNASLIHDTTVVFDRVEVWASEHWRGVVALQATLTVQELDTVELSCSTYKGGARFGSLVAVKVDAIEVQ